jgi:hypothetical protein
MEVHPFLSVWHRFDSERELSFDPLVFWNTNTPFGNIFAYA